MKLLEPFILRARIVDHDYLARILAKPGVVLFEPAQGVLLDEWRGFHPYTTWSTCTLDNAHALLEEVQFKGEVTRLGIVRAYATRHGPGPFPSFDAKLTQDIPDADQRDERWNGKFLVGHFDAVLTRYAIECVGKLDGIVITCLDRLRDVDDWQMVTSYKAQWWDPDLDQLDDDQFICQYKRLIPGPFKDLVYQERITNLLGRIKPLLDTTTRAPDFETRVREHVARIESELGLPAYMLSFGPTANDKQFLRE